MEKTRTIIKPTAAFSFDFKEFWHYRELLYFFAWRDLKVKYKQTALGVLWALLQPLALLLLFTLVFSKTSIAQERNGMSYTLFVLSGLIVWNLFNTAISHAADSMVANAGIIKKIYFPRLLIPVATVLTALVDFTIAFFIFLIFCAGAGSAINWTAFLFFPAAILLCVCTAFGLGALLGALNVKYRDFRYALPFFLQALFFSTQIIYPATLIKAPWLKYVFALNPLNAALELFRIPISRLAADWLLIGIGASAGFFLMVAGFYYFKKTEAYFADII